MQKWPRLPYQLKVSASFNLSKPQLAKATGPGATARKSSKLYEPFILTTNTFFGMRKTRACFPAALPPEEKRC